MSSAVLPSSRINLEKISVMLVDDNQQSLDLLCQIVTGFGVKRLMRFSSPHEAQENLRRHTVDLIISDAHMPAMDGYELTRWLRREGPDPTRFVPVIIVTGHTRESEVMKARDSGVSFTVAKPLTPKIMLERIFFVAREERMFIEAQNYVGPDRRFKRLGPPAGMDGRRSDDLAVEVGEAQTPNLSQEEINLMMKPTKVSL
ncbi:MAG: response regulator [Caulobacter sp.]|nr:response regulator [Caulobacter sp.]